jgi:hypothetical protein
MSLPFRSLPLRHRVCRPVILGVAVLCAACGGVPVPAQVAVGTGNVWVTYLERDPDRFAERVALARALDLQSIRISGSGRQFLGRQVNLVERTADALAAEGSRTIVVGVNGRLPTLTPEAGYTPEAIRAGGEAFGRLAARRPDLNLVFSVGNEPDNARLPDRVERAAEILRAFASGAKSACPACTVVSGGLAYPDRPSAVDFLAAYAPLVEEGLLDGIGLHWYLNRDEVARLREDPFKEQHDRLLAEAGLPPDTPIYVQEMGVRADQYPDPREHAEATAAALHALAADPRVRLIHVWGVFEPDDSERWRVVSGTPTAAAVAAFAREAGE